MGVVMGDLRGLFGLRGGNGQISGGHWVSDGTGRDSYIHQDPGLVNGPLSDLRGPRPLKSKEALRKSPCKSFKTVKSLAGTRQNPNLPKEGRLERWLDWHEQPGSIVRNPTKCAAPHPDELMHSGIRRRGEAPVWPGIPVPRHRYFSEGQLGRRLGQRDNDKDLGRTMTMASNSASMSALRNGDMMADAGYGTR